MTWLAILLALSLVLAAFAAGAETALTSVSRLRMRTLAEDGDHRASRVVRLHNNPNGYLSTIRRSTTYRSSRPRLSPTLSCPAPTPPPPATPRPSVDQHRRGHRGLDCDHPDRRRPYSRRRPGAEHGCPRRLRSRLLRDRPQVAGAAVQRAAGVAPGRAGPVPDPAAEAPDRGADPGVPPPPPALHPRPRRPGPVRHRGRAQAHPRHGRARGRGGAGGDRK